MTTIVEALDRIARQCSIKAPSSWVTATRDDHVSLRDDFLAETVDDILDRIDLPSPIGAQVALSTLSSSVNSDGSRTFTLPPNFNRLHRSPLAVYDKEQDRPCVPVTSDGQFAYLADVGTSGAVHFYQIKGYEGNYTATFYSDPTATSAIIISYSTFNWMSSGGGTIGDVFTQEEDLLLLPRRAVESGSVWRYRERRGLPYTDKYNEYELLLTRLSNDSRTRRVVNMGSRDHVRWQDLVPSFIPPS